jgi:hypothetical protein
MIDEIVRIDEIFTYFFVNQRRTLNNPQRKCEAFIWVIADRYEVNFFSFQGILGSRAYLQGNDFGGFILMIVYMI